MPEEVVTVDSGDNVIGWKERDDVSSEDFYRVSALWIENSSGEVLLAKRSSGKKKGGGKWGPAVADTVAKGESYEENIRKEAGEELGLKDVDFERGPKAKVTERHNHFVQWFELKMDKELEEFEIQEEEVESIKWFSKKELKEKVENEPGDFIYTMDRWAELLIG